MEWSGSVAVITGASRGIGAAVARAAAGRGARLGLIARSEGELSAVLDTCGGSGTCVVADVADRAQITDAIDAIERELGSVDVLVNNAGIGAYGRFDEADLELLERMMRVNYLGTVYATKAVLPGMLARGRGHIVNLASIAGRVGAPLEAGYSASKFAVVGLSEALGFELHGKGIGVSLVDPGPVRTDFFDARGAPYTRPRPKPVAAESVAELVMRAVAQGKAEQFIPRWLRVAWMIRVLMPGAYRRGTLREFKGEL